MLVAIGKGIELDVDVTRFNIEVHDHIMRTGIRNLLMDAHASATAKADPEGYVKKSRELAEKKLASFYAGVVRAQSVGGAAKPTDPISAVVMRLARMAIQKEKASDIAAAPKDQRLALVNRLAAQYAQAHDGALRPRAEKIVALEAEPLPGEEGRASGQRQEGRLRTRRGAVMEPDSTLAPFFYLAVAWRVVRDPRGGCRGARHHCDRMGGHL